MRSDVNRLLELTDTLAGLAVTTAAAVTQAVIGAWFGSIAGRVYTAGGRIEIGGVHGEVIDIATLLEIGGTPCEGGTWVTARRPTGRPVASNERTFTDPVLNHPGRLDWIWEEPAFATPQDADWERAERIVLEANVPRHGERALADPDPAEERA